jgi:hypothetical protein
MSNATILGTVRSRGKIVRGASVIARNAAVLCLNGCWITQAARRGVYVFTAAAAGFEAATTRVVITAADMRSGKAIRRIISVRAASQATAVTKNHDGRRKKGCLDVSYKTEKRRGIAGLAGSMLTP